MNTRPRVSWHHESVSVPSVCACVFTQVSFEIDDGSSRHSDTEEARDGDMVASVLQCFGTERRRTTRHHVCCIQPCILPVCCLPAPCPHAQLLPFSPKC